MWETWFSTRNNSDQPNPYEDTRESLEYQYLIKQTDGNITVVYLTSKSDLMASNQMKVISDHGLTYKLPNEPLTWIYIPARSIVNIKMNTPKRKGD